MPIEDDTGECQGVTLKLVCGPGDFGEPCLTVMKPDEDRLNTGGRARLKGSAT